MRLSGKKTFSFGPTRKSAPPSTEITQAPDGFLVCYTRTFPQMSLINYVAYYPRRKRLFPLRVKVKVNQSSYRPGGAQSVPGS